MKCTTIEPFLVGPYIGLDMKVLDCMGGLPAGTSMLVVLLRSYRALAMVDCVYGTFVILAHVDRK